MYMNPDGKDLNTRFVLEYLTLNPKPRKLLVPSQGYQVTMLRDPGSRTHKLECRVEAFWGA